MSAILDTIIEQAKHLPPEEQAELLEELEEMMENGHTPSEPVRIDYRKFLGSGKGLYKDTAEVDAFIRSLRDEWED